MQSKTCCSFILGVSRACGARFHYTKYDFNLINFSHRFTFWFRRLSFNWWNERRRGTRGPMTVVPIETALDMWFFFLFSLSVTKSSHHQLVNVSLHEKERTWIHSGCEAAAEGHSGLLERFVNSMNDSAVTVFSLYIFFGGYVGNSREKKIDFHSFLTWKAKKLGRKT